MLSVQREVVRLAKASLNQPNDARRYRACALVCARFADVARGFAPKRSSRSRPPPCAKPRTARSLSSACAGSRDRSRLISGVEEARLIWVGVSSGIELGDRKAVLIDIGGAARRSSLHGGGLSDAGKHEARRDSPLQPLLRFRGPVARKPSPASKKLCPRRGDAGGAARHRRRVSTWRWQRGTITTLADIVARRLGDPPVNSQRNYTFRLSDLREVVQALCRIASQKTACAYRAWTPIAPTSSSAAPPSS